MQAMVSIPVTQYQYKPMLSQNFIKTVVVLCILFQLPYILCWSEAGHQAIGMTAMSGLTNASLTNFKRLSGGKDIADISYWGHRLIKRYPDMEKVHFMEQQDLTCAIFSIEKCLTTLDQLATDTTGNPFYTQGLIKTLSHKKESVTTFKFNGGSFSSTYFTGSNVCMLNALRDLYLQLTSQTDKKLPNMTFPKKLSFGPLDGVAYVAALIADMHQPTHFPHSKGSDKGKEFLNMPVKIRQRNNKVVDTSLFDFWETKLTQIAMEREGGAWYGGWTHVNFVGKEFETDIAEFERLGVGIFKQWAKENFKLLCELVLQYPSTNAPVVSGDIFELRDQELWAKELKNLLRRAGGRVAIVLNKILSSQDPAKLRTAVVRTSSIIPDEDHVHMVFPWFKNFVINFMIILIIGLIFWYLVRWHAGSGPPEVILGKARHQDSASVEMKTS